MITTVGPKHFGISGYAICECGNDMFKFAVDGLGDIEVECIECHSQISFRIQVQPMREPNEYEVKQHELNWCVLVFETKQGRRELIGEVAFKYPLPNAKQLATEYAELMTCLTAGSAQIQVLGERLANTEHK